MQATVDKLDSELKAKDEKIELLSDRVAKLEASSIEQTHKLIQLKTLNLEELSPKELIDLWLFGDSIIKHADVDYMNPGGNNCKTYVLGGFIEDLRKEVLKALAKFEIGEILLQLGSNNAESESANYIVHQLVALVQEIKRISPHTTVYVGNILPRRINKNVNTNFKIFSDIHRKLQGASRDGSFILVNNYQFWRKDDKNEYTQNFKLFTRKDFVHLNFKGVELLTENFTFRHTFGQTQVPKPAKKSPPAPQLNSSAKPVIPGPQIIITEDNEFASSSRFRHRLSTPRKVLFTHNDDPFVPHTLPGHQNVTNDMYKRPRRGSF